MYVCTAVGGVCVLVYVYRFGRCRLLAGAAIDYSAFDYDYICREILHCLTMLFLHGNLKGTRGSVLGFIRNRI